MVAVGLVLFGHPVAVGLPDGMCRFVGPLFDLAFSSTCLVEPVCFLCSAFLFGLVGVKPFACLVRLSGRLGFVQAVLATVPFDDQIVGSVILCHGLHEKKNVG